jgi:DNA-binding MarR family transcriptional regulator
MPEPNNPNPDPNPDHNPTPDPDPKPDPKPEPKPKSDDLVTIKVNGEDKSVTYDELVKMAEKSGGADETFRKAAATRKSGERGVKIATLIDQISSSEDGPSQADISELAGLLGVDSSDLVDALDTKEPTSTTKTSSVEANKSKKKVSLEDLDPATQEILKDAQKQQFAKIVEGIKEEAKKGVDKDETLAKIVKGAGDGKNDVHQVLIDMVYKDIQRRVQAGGQYGPEMVSDAVLSTRTAINKLGVPTTPSKQLNDALLLGFGPESGGIPAEALSDEPVKRVASTDTNYENNVVARALQQLRSSNQSSK